MSDDAKKILDDLKNGTLDTKQASGEKEGKGKGLISVNYRIRDDSKIACRNRSKMVLECICEDEPDKSMLSKITGNNVAVKERGKGITRKTKEGTK